MKILLTLILLTLTVYTQTNTITGGQIRPRIIKTSSSKKINKARKFHATAYCLKGRTASGEYVRHGIIAADPRVLRLGTKVHIEGMGIFIVKDTGSAVRNHKIDIWMSSKAAALKFGRKEVQLTILD